MSLSKVFSIALTGFKLLNTNAVRDLEPLVAQINAANAVRKQTFSLSTDLLPGDLRNL